MISNAPEEATSISDDNHLTTTTMRAPLTYHESDELTTLFEEIAAKSTMDVTTSSTMTPSTIALEVKTIFPPINNIHNNEHHHHNAFDEKLPIVIATASTTAVS